MYNDFFMRPYRSRVSAKIMREIVHKLNPEEFFIKFMKKQQNPCEIPSYVLTFDFDFESDVKAFPYLLDILQKYNVKAGFAVIGKFVEKYPDIHKRAVDEGHEIINHTYTHPDNPHWAPNRYFNKISYQEQKDEIYKAHEVFYNLLGVDCIGFRTPHYGQLHTQSVYDILNELNYKYSSSTPSYGTSGFGAPYIHKYNIVEIPTGCSPSFPFAIFDSWSMLRMAKPLLKSDEDFIKEFDYTMKVVNENNFFLTHYFDPYDIVENGKIEGILDSIKKYEISTKLYKDLI